MSSMPCLTVHPRQPRFGCFILRSQSALVRRVLMEEPANQEKTSQTYTQWRAGFAGERLVVLYYLGLIANPVFFAADYLLHSEHLYSLLTIRIILETALLAAFVMLKRRVLPHNALLVLWVLIGNL